MFSRIQLYQIFIISIVSIGIHSCIGLILNTKSNSQLRIKYFHRKSELFSTNPQFVQAEGSGSPCRIKVIGVGGGGGNAVNRMMESSTGILGVELWAVNTDAQALSRSLAPKKLNIGSLTSRGLGAGGSPAVGAQAATESRDEITEMVKDADLVFVTAGMGGGTGSGAAPIVADCAKQAGALTVGVVTKPFGFEGRKRMQQAKEAILEMKGCVDTLIVVSNDKLLEIVPENTPLTDAFLVADDILRQGVVGISEIIIKPGLVNVDFADVRSIMGNAGTALMGIGQGKGKTRAMDAAMAAISSPLLDFPISKAKGIIFNIVGGPDMTLQEINSAAEVIYANVDVDANIIFGALVDDKVTSGEVSITVLATGFATDFYSSDAEAAEAAELQARKTAGSGVGAAKKAAVTAVNARAAENRAPKDASTASAGPTRQKLPSSLNAVGKQQPSIANMALNKQVRRPSEPERRSPPRRGSDDEFDEEEPSNNGAEEDNFYEDEVADDDDTYIDPNQRASRTVGSVGGGGALGRGGRSPVMGGPRGLSGNGNGKTPVQNKPPAAGAKQVPDKNDSNRYKGIRGFLRKLFE